MVVVLVLPVTGVAEVLAEDPPEKGPALEVD